MKHYLAVSFLVVFLYIYDASAATCTCDDDSTVKVGEYCLVEGTNNEWEKCQSDGNLASAIKTCPKGEFFYNNYHCVKCSDVLNNEFATTNGPGFTEYDCYIPEDKVPINCTVNNSDESCTIAPSVSCPKITATKTIKQGKYILCDTGKYILCETDECEPITTTTTTPCKNENEVFVDGACITCANLTGHTSALSGKETGEATRMSDCYIPKKEHDSDEKGEFEYVAQCYVGCTDSNSYLCPSA